MKLPESGDECSFFSRRTLDDGTKLFIWVPKGTAFANIVYDCGKCKHHGELTQEFQKPITFVCQKCGTQHVAEALKKRGRKKKTES